MNKYDFVSVPLSSELVSRVSVFLSKSESGKTLNEVIDHFIEYGLENAQWKLEDGDDIFGVQNNKSEEGYLWAYDKKSLFLPNGTKIMRKYKGQDYYATLLDKRFIFEDKKFKSPAELAIALSGGTSVNAWITLRVKRPNDSSWRLAEELAMH